jgi:hypothetical protein
MVRTVVLALTFALIGSSSTFAQDSAPDPQFDIVVTGVRPEQIQVFVEQVSTAPPSVDQIARWDDDICISAVGLGAEQSQTVIDRVSLRAQAVGLRPGRMGCRPNVFVFFASDGSGFARGLLEQRRSLFAYYHEENIATLGQEALTSFVETSRPVRWWHVIQTRGADGDRLGSDSARSEAPPPPDTMTAVPDGFSGVQSVRSQGTRMRSVERQDFNRVVIIVDARLAEGYPLDSIADYVAMVTLAQIDPQGQVRDFPTILNLFNEDLENTSFEMTNWDTAYLSGLYRSARNAASMTQQVRDISRRMSSTETGSN